MEDNFDLRSYLYNNSLFKENEDSYKKYGLDVVLNMLKEASTYHEGVETLKEAIKHIDKNPINLNEQELNEYKNLLTKLSDKWIGKEINESKESQIWDSLTDDQKLDALGQAIKDPDDAERFVSWKWNNLPPEISANINFDYMDLKETEVGGREDVEFADIISVHPYDEILMQVRNDWGKDSDLYGELLNQFVGTKLNLPKVIAILKNYDVYDEYKHYFNMNEDKLKELIKKTLKEMSVTGGGGAGAGFTAGVGMNYATPKAFKRLKNKK